MDRKDENQPRQTTEQQSGAGFGPAPQTETSEVPQSHSLDKDEGRMNNGEIGGGLTPEEDQK